MVLFRSKNNRNIFYVETKLDTTVSLSTVGPEDQKVFLWIHDNDCVHLSNEECQELILTLEHLRREAYGD